MEATRAHIRSLFRGHQEIYEEAYEGRQFHALYFSMMVFACLIALLGLLLNSPAVIIGAMLISPLMGPILACGLAFTLADFELGKKAGRNVLFSVVEAILIAALATSLSPLKDATPEILARTTPNLMDLLIAFFSGLAGTLALASRKGGLTILPGVAIATAVMPPLATVGYGLSTRQWSIASGAFMLFFTNFTAIVISAGLVFLLIGFSPREVHGREKTLFVRWRIAIAAVVLLALSVPLLRTLLRAARQAGVRKEITAALRKSFNRPGHRRLATVDVRIGRDLIVADSAVQTADFIEPHEVIQIERALSGKIGRPVQLLLNQVQLAEQRPKPPPANSRDFLAGGVVRSDGAEPHELPVADVVARLQDRVQTSLLALLRPAGIADLQVTSLGVEPGGAFRVEAVGSESALTNLQAWQVASTALAAEFKSPIHLLARLRVDDGQAVDLHYRGKAVRPSAKDLAAAAATLRAWKGDPSVRVLAVCDATVGDLLEPRVSFLRRWLAAPEPVEVASVPSLEAGVVRLTRIHLVDVRPAPVAPQSMAEKGK